MQDGSLPRVPIYDNVAAFEPDSKMRDAEALLAGFPCQADALIYCKPERCSFLLVSC